MYECKKIGSHTHYIESPAKIGLFEHTSGMVTLIDSGSDKDAGRKVRQHLDQNNWKLSSILNTHSNADHIGGNKYLQDQTGCTIYAPGIECDFTNHPVLEPSFLYGAFPPAELRHKFLMAQESKAELLSEAVLPEGLSILSLPGHFFDMVGFKTLDDVIFLADCLSSKETLDKYQIGFLYDVSSYLSTLEMVKTLQAAAFVPAHAAVTDNIAPLAQLNIDKVHEIEEKIHTLCKNEPLCFEQILQKLFTTYELTMNFAQYVLVGSTVRSYLSWMLDAKKLQIEYKDGMMLWRSVSN